MRKYALASASIAALFAANTAHAQQGPTAAASEVTLQDIVVTANRSESIAQKTATSLTVYTGDNLAKSGISDIASLGKLDPSVNFTGSSGSGYVAVRGIASADITEIGDPSVPISRDGFFSNRPFSLQLSMYDVSRVEILKGPQGTLNGRNSTGGLISIISNRPTKDTGGYGSLEIGNFNTVNGEAGVNIAATDQLQFRISGIYRHHKGYRFLTGPNQRVDDEDGASGRIQAAYQPVEGLRLWASYQHDDIDSNGDAVLISPIGIRPAFGDAKTFGGYTPLYNKVKIDRYRWEAVYNNLPGDLTLTYMGGYEDARFRHSLDATDITFAYPAIRQFKQDEHPRTTNHEIRIATSSDKPFSLQAGYFYFKEHSSLDSGVFNYAMIGPFAPGGPLAALSQAGAYALHFPYDIKTTSQAVFGQAGYRFNDQWKLTAGARYTWDKKIRTGTPILSVQALVSPFAPPIFVPLPGNGDMRDKQPSFHLGLDYTPTSQTLVYAKFDTGYKSGGFNVTATDSTTYNPEKVQSYEVGTKNRFFDNKIQANASAFYMTYSNYQANKFDAGGLAVFNAGGAKIYGVEGQFTALVGEGGRLDVNATYLHTRFNKGIIVASGDPAESVPDPLDPLKPVGRPIGGNDLPNAPKFVLSAAYEQKFDVGNGQVTAEVDGKYSSSFYYSVFNDPDTQSKDYVLLNASVTYAPENAIWQIQAFVRNITDKEILARAGRNFNALRNEYQFQPPRTYGVRGSVKF